MAETEVRVLCSTAEMDIVKTFECGQCFRWNADEEGTYWGIAMGCPAKLWVQGDTVYIKTSGDMEMWREYFDLDRDYGEISRSFDGGEYLSMCVSYGFGIRILRQDPWEALCSFLISQNNHIPRIKGIIERLCQLLGEPIGIATVLDAACGSGGMLSTTYDFLRRKNPYVDVRLFGQEINPESYAICLADMLIKGQDVKNIMGDEEANTLKTDCFPDQKMRLVIMNPPFGTPWGGKDAPEGQEKKVREENKKGGRFEHGLPGTGDAQLLFMQHAINKLDEKNGRAAIITNGSPLFSGGTTSGESQIRRWMLEEDLIEAIIALPTQLFYNTDIGIYIFILSRNKRPDRRGKVQLINAVDMWKPLRKSLGKKRREIDRDSMKKITELYSNFEENQYCKIFPNEEFMYKEYAVYQPLQRRGVLDAESIERLRTSSYFTSNSSIFNETDFEQLKEMNPRSAADEKKYQKYLAGQQFVADVLNILEANSSDQVFMDYGEFEKYLKSLLGKAEGMSASRLTGIAMVLAVMDKTAVVQKDRKGEIIKDTTTKDTEIIKLTQDPEKYFEAEVYPHVPDAIWAYEFDPEKKESATNKEKLGAEFPFTRFFYEYKEPEKADDLLAQFMELEKSLSEKIASLQESEGV